MAWVYILECSGKSYYVGSSVDLESRVSRHQLGLGAEYTKGRLPVTLRWAAEFERVDDAYAFEKQVQGWSRRKREALMRGEFHALRGLSSRSWDCIRARDGGLGSQETP